MQNKSSTDCVQNWKSTHRQVCYASGNICNHCEHPNHLAKVCQKMKHTQQSNRINNVEIFETTENSDNQNINFINYHEQYDSQYDSFDDNNVAMREQNTSKTIALRNLNMLTSNTDCNLLLDSSSGSRQILNLSLAKHIMLNCIQAEWS